MSIYAIRTKFPAWIRISLIILLAVVFAIGGFSMFGGNLGGVRKNNSAMDRPMAIVNGVVIPKSSFQARWEDAAKKMADQGVKSPAMLANVKTNIVMGLINEQVMVKIAKEEGVDFSILNKEIDKQVVGTLKVHRKMTLGKLSKEREAIDPRDDNEYKKELSGIGQSIRDVENRIRASITEDQVMAQIARDGIIKKVEDSIGSISDKELRDSYKVFTVRQIILAPGKVSADQLAAKADKIVSQIRGGADFAALAKDNSSMPSAGPIQMSFENRFSSLPTEVRNAVSTMQPGKVSDPIKVNEAYFIVQLVSVKDNYPAKLDEKAKKARETALREDKKNEGLMSIEKKMQEKQDVVFKDPELKGYWILGEAMKAKSLEESKTKLADAAKAFLAYIANEKGEANGKGGAPEVYQYAMIEEQLGNTANAVKILKPYVFGDSAPIVSADMSLMLGDLLAKTGDKTEAVQAYQEADKYARLDTNVMAQLVQAFKKVGRSDLASQEQSKLTTTMEKIKIWEKQNSAKFPSSSPTGTP